jgi:hypothetical protein
MIISICGLNYMRVIQNLKPHTNSQETPSSIQRKSILLNNASLVIFAFLWACLPHSIFNPLPKF